ncbi:hypothetical protein [Kocuria palustris]|uniref:hypothetical protein n=1 Tax=Kocuria palustris TaxID=71999 RepID=UPI003D722889
MNANPKHRDLAHFVHAAKPGETFSLDGGGRISTFEVVRRHDNRRMPGESDTLQSIKAARAARTTAEAAEAEAAEAEAARRSRAAVAALRNEHGYSLTDSAALLGISRSRVIQLNREATDA